MTRRVAVLGAGGFVGARYLEMAVLSGRTDVVPVVRAFRSMARNAYLGVPHRLADASRPDALRQALAGCEVVVNLTAGDPSKILSTTQSVYESAASGGASLLIHMSTAAVYGRIERPELSDDAPPERHSTTEYARQKGLAEIFLRSKMGQGRMGVVVLRPGLVWGPGSPWLIGPAIDLVRGAAYLAAAGKGICNLIYVDNLVSSIDAVVATTEGRSGFYHVGDDETTTWREYYHALAAGLGCDPATIHMFSSDGYRADVRERIAAIRTLSGYRWLKDRVPLERRAALKIALARGRGFSDVSTSAAPALNRALWEVQTTRYALPTDKFRATFGAHSRTTFASGMSASLEWLRFIGLSQSEALAATSRVPLTAALSGAAEP